MFKKKSTFTESEYLSFKNYLQKLLEIKKPLELTRGYKFCCRDKIQNKESIA